jgi:Spy/CpxP family protein refolding chaperone
MILGTIVLMGALMTGLYADVQNTKTPQESTETQKRTSWIAYKMRLRGIIHDKTISEIDGTEMFSQLELTQQQEFKITVAKSEMDLEMKKFRGPKHVDQLINFIDVNGFDKESFKKAAYADYIKMMDIKVNFIEKVAKVLTNEQIAELKSATN